MPSHHTCTHTHTYTHTRTHTHTHTLGHTVYYSKTAHMTLTNTESQLQELHTVIRSTRSALFLFNYLAQHTQTHAQGHVIRSTTVSYCTVSSHSTTHYHIVTYMTLYSHCTTVLLYIVTNYASSVAQHVKCQVCMHVHTVHHKHDTHTSVNTHAQQCHHVDSRVDQQVLTH